MKNTQCHSIIRFNAASTQIYLERTFPDWPKHRRLEKEGHGYFDMDCECLFCAIRNFHLKRLPNVIDVPSEDDETVWAIMGREMWVAADRAELEDHKKVPDWAMPRKITHVGEFQETANRFKVSIAGQDAFLLVDPDNLFNSFHDAYMYLEGHQPRRKGYWRGCDLLWATSLAAHEVNGWQHHYPHCTWYGSSHDGDLSWKSPFTKMPLLFQQPGNRIGKSLKPGTYSLLKHYD